MSDSLSWKLLTEQTVKKDHWVDLRSRSYLLPNGRELSPYYSYHNRSFTVIAARDEAGDFICVRQFRPGIAEVTTEFPAGGIEPGEEPLEAAKRELLEETGCVSECWSFLGRIAPNATIADNYAYCYLAEGCRKQAERQLDETECMETIVVPRSEMQRLIQEGGFVQAVHIAVYYLMQAGRTR
ncbi:ADP-ribose pyrophosphatase [Fusobacterium naviforme]|uniref:ADP-ribose pyrophosphatase n=1 Tax=Moryella indoligenes TaxID=371674 RepID=A0AAE3V7Z7_9FIRM|nr:NUDIX hydrolase [Moryella indoligenes]KAB0576909.1 NUDIX hydrolase [Fusobacterium naviforme]MDQ0151416.1 ADP-ribose pyrophosphatase [Moryella indoligenes]PSL09931.1 ADP-ribose pyrophosphatase [Fusobacterium naviforme]STO27895.1 ADP-ribose pyrophosphatase [Fusobacterium naviforme]